MSATPVAAAAAAAATNTKAKRAWLRAFRRRLARHDALRSPVEDTFVRGDVTHVSRRLYKEMDQATTMRTQADVHRHNDLLTQDRGGLSALQEGEVRRRVWGSSDALTEPEALYVARRAGGEWLRVAAGGGDGGGSGSEEERRRPRRVTTARAFLRDAVLLRDATPFFAPRANCCAACDAPLGAAATATACGGGCRTRYCGPACAEADRPAHALECAMAAAGTTGMLEETFGAGLYAQHTARRLPVHGRFLTAPPTRQKAEEFAAVCKVVCRVLSLVQRRTAPGAAGAAAAPAFVDPTALPLLSFLPYTPVSEPRDLAPENQAPPVERSLLFHAARHLDGLLRARGHPPSQCRTWDLHGTSLWNLWEVVVHCTLLTPGALHPVVNLLPHSDNPSVALYRPTNKLAYLVARRDIAEGEELTLDYAAGTPEGERKARLVRAYGIRT